MWIEEASAKLFVARRDPIATMVSVTTGESDRKFKIIESEREVEREREKLVAHANGVCEMMREADIYKAQLMNIMPLPFPGFLFVTYS